MPKPVVALVGRPNVGKSTLFNRLAGERLAIVDDVPGTTRDRLVAETEWNNVVFNIIDTGGIDPTHGGKTPLSVGSADFIQEIREQALMAVNEADAVLFITDGSAGVTPPDREVAGILRRYQKTVDGQRWPPIFVVVNKCENEKLRSNAAEFYELGLGDPYPVSAIHGTGTGDLLDALVNSFPAQVEAEEDDSVKIAIVGKPNAGKSSLLNKLVGQERAIVSPIPGTTRDAVDTRIEVDGLPVTLIDTAGIRRRGKIEQGVEKFSVLRSFKAIERADVALLIVDAEAGITAQDTHIAGFILEAWKSTVVLVNKWDAIEKDTYTMDDYTRHVRQELNFMDYVPAVIHLGQNRPARGPGAANGLARPGGAAGPHHHRHAEPGFAGCPGCSSRSIPRRAPVEDLLWLPGQGGSADFCPACQRSEIVPFFLYALPGKSIPGNLWLPWDAHQDHCAWA